ncbi:hypothetical protein OCU04_003872 [Sclerotinia nivalis]|uniref:Uncharacterized protein n=1 Tax=Sclerotinia nivalis TaxID=352851 RepID=A0A9X0ASX4_9HELO|nr:hypothetical protein OCU04_003872 [Sclerotinia nivalis]
MARLSGGTMAPRWPDGTPVSPRKTLHLSNASASKKSPNYTRHNWNNLFQFGLTFYDKSQLFIHPTHYNCSVRHKRYKPLVVSTLHSTSLLYSYDRPYTAPGSIQLFQFFSVKYNWDAGMGVEGKGIISNLPVAVDLKDTPIQCYSGQRHGCRRLPVGVEMNWKDAISLWLFLLPLKLGCRLE